MKDFQIDEKTLNFFRHEIETHTRPIDEISKELELFDGIKFSPEDIINEISCAFDLRIGYLKQLQNQWEVEYKNTFDINKRATTKKYLNQVTDTIYKIETLQRYLYKDYEIVSIEEDIE